MQIRDDLRKQFTADSDDNPLADLPARVAGGRQAVLRPAQHPPAGDEPDDPGPADRARARARGEGEGRGGRAGGRARHRQGPLVRGGRLRRARRDRRPPGRRLRRGRRRQGRHAARPATSSSRSRAAPARRAGASSSRPRPRGCPSPRRSRSSTAPAPSATPTTPCSSSPTRSGSRRSMHELREYGGDKLVVCFDPEDGSDALARGRLLAGPGARADGARRGRRRRPAAIREAIERADRRDGRRAARQAAAHRRQDLDRQGRRDPRRDGRRRPRTAAPRSSCCWPRAGEERTTAACAAAGEAPRWRPTRSRRRSRTRTLAGADEIQPVSAGGAPRGGRTATRSAESSRPARDDRHRVRRAPSPDALPRAPSSSPSRRGSTRGRAPRARRRGA